MNSVISKKARIGTNVKIGDYCKVYDDVQIGDNSQIEDYSVIGYPTKLAKGSILQIGKNTLIRSHSIIYQGSIIDDDFSTGHRVTIRENSTIGKNVQVGTLSDLQGDLAIGDFTKLHSNVHIGKKSRIGKFVWIFPYVVLTNDPHPPSETLLGVTIEDFSALGTMSVILPGVTVKKGCLVAAGSIVGRTFSEAMLIAGNPGKEIKSVREIKLKDGSGLPAYPWTKHFHKGYPEEEIKKWLENDPY